MAEHTIKVSVITVSYNAAKTIEQTIQSVLKQSYPNIEYLVIDGKSTDGTQRVIEKYRNEISYYVSEPDQGIYDAMNKGISRASGDVIGIINSDDWYETDAVEKVVNCFEKKNADVVFGEIWLIDSNGNKRSCTKNSILPPHPAMFVKRNAYRKYGVFDISYAIAADYELTLRLLSKGAAFERIDCILSNFRTTGISSIKKRECIEETYQIQLEYVGRCPSEILNRDIAEELYNRSRLLYTSQYDPETIIEVLKSRFSKLSRGIVIFGTGNWGRELHTVLRSCNIEIPFFVDNDSKKWGFEWEGSKIFSPEILKDYDGPVLIAVKHFQKELREQIYRYTKGNSFVDVYDRLWEAVIRDSAWRS